MSAKSTSQLGKKKKRVEGPSGSSPSKKAKSGGTKARQKLSKVGTTKPATINSILKDAKKAAQKKTVKAKPLGGSNKDGKNENVTQNKQTEGGSTSGQNNVHPNQQDTTPKTNSAPNKGSEKPNTTLVTKQRVKLAPPRPFPSVPSSSNATGPRSARAEGNNMICITRKTKLAAYLRRCKELVMKDGYKTIHLHAMAAAIPHLVLLATSLPEILPHPTSEIRVEYLTGTVECVDEVFIDPEDTRADVDEDNEGGLSFSGELESRNKSCLKAIICIGDGLREVSGKEKKVRRRSKPGPKDEANGARDGKGLEDDAMSSDSDF